jgi:hypothetical protein
MVRRVPVIGTITLREKAVMQIAIPLFPKVTALDAIRPYEVLQRVPQLNIALSATLAEKCGQTLVCWV